MTDRTPEGVAEALLAAGADLVGPATLTGTVQVDVTGGPDGDVVLWLSFDGGRLTGTGAGPAGSPDATLTLGAADARAVATGALDPSVAFMQGRMKVAGDMGPVLDLLALSATPAAAAVRARVAGTA